MAASITRYKECRRKTADKIFNKHKKRDFVRLKDVIVRQIFLYSRFSILSIKMLQSCKILIYDKQI